MPWDTLLLIWREEKKLVEESEEDQPKRKTKSQGKKVYQGESDHRCPTLPTAKRCQELTTGDHSVRDTGDLEKSNFGRMARVQKPGVQG